MSSAILCKIFSKKITDTLVLEKECKLCYMGLNIMYALELGNT